MLWLWQWIISILVWLSADPHRLATEPARAAAAVAAARSAVVDAAVVRAGVESVAAVPTPKFDAHAAKCKRCFNRNPNGPGLCDEGFRLLQADLRDAKKTCTTGTCPKK
jgi:hypothetical protein